MLWHGRPYGCGSWLPKDKKYNMWHGRRNAVVFGRLPSPAFAGGIMGFKAIILKPRSPGGEIYVYLGLNYIEFREQF